MATWAVKQLLVNVDSRKLIKSTTQIVDPTNAGRLSAVAGDMIVLGVSFVNQAGVAYGLGAGDTFDCGFDKDFQHVLDEGTAGSGYSGAVVSIEVAGLTETIPTTGYIVLINGAGETDRVAYTDYAAGTFTVSATLDYVYLLGDTVQVEDELMAYADDTAVDVAGDWADIDRDEGKISIRLNCNTDAFARKIAAATGNDLLSYLQIRRYPSGETQPTTMLQDWGNASKAVIDGEGTPGTTQIQYLTQTSADARYVRGQANLVNAGRATIVSTAGTITQTDISIGAADGIVSRAGMITLTPTGSGVYVSTRISVGINTFVGTELFRADGGATATATVNSVCIGGGSVNSGVDSYFYGVRVGRGGGAVATNTCVGNGAMAATATGGTNSAFGELSLAAVTSGSANTAIGRNALNDITTQSNNTAIGLSSLAQSTSSNGTAVGWGSGISLTTATQVTLIGYQSGRYQSGGTTALTESTNSVLLGGTTKGTQSATNEIAVGYAAEGRGSNTAQWGNTSIANHYMAGNLNLLSDNGLLLLGAGGDASVTYDGTAMKIVTDLVAASDLDVDCGTAKTLRLVEPVTIDINFPAGTAQKPASSEPDVVTFLDNLGADTDIATVGFAVGEKLGWCFEYNHQCVTNGSLQFHVHFQVDAAPSGTDYVNWQIDYCIVHDGETCPPVTTITTTDVAIDTQYEQVFAAWTTLTGINLTIGDQIRVKLSRIAAAGDAYAGDCKLCTFGAHVQVDTLGSRTGSAK